MKRTLSTREAFTLIELLTVVAVIAVLATVITAGMRSARDRALETKEVANARTLIGAYLNYAAENAGELMPGFGDFHAEDDHGTELNSPENQRYPWRLAPYLQKDMRVLWNSKSDRNMQQLAANDHKAYVYAVSVQPALGINATFVGGDYQNLPPDKPKVRQKFGNFCVTRLGQATNPSSLIVFASAGSNHQGKKLDGYFIVEPPKINGRRWKSSYTRNAPEQFGFVDFRHDDRAVVAMLDGHVEVRDFKYLDDMRLWANPAAEANDPSWQLGKTY